MADPAVAPEGKSDAVVQLLATRVHHVLLSFLLVLVRENRWRDAPAIAGRFARIARGDGDGVESGEVVTAVPLDPGRVAAIEKEVGRILGRDVRLRAVVNPDVVGGVAVHAGGFAVDGTVERMLRDARQALLER
jgi:F-type H+-transporting ATPase subunit delta